ncbi:Prephenate dehydrogenase [Mycena chlorophos]|uniref:Prephenate dehydrogenase [NADP(+)] n=1 Tax=Mycena chlorophos TaxID=658473 RepID=A0A8H6TTD8_MYCCL|nr:Prephenate dehydrogenase [Mycena chlorophos]
MPKKASATDSFLPANMANLATLETQPTIGLIGMGAMGRMYAKYLSQGGWAKINVCDLPTKYEALKAEYEGVSGIVVLKDGHAVSRSSDFIMYAVEAEFIERVVAEYGPSTKLNAIVSGQTSVKAPEKAAFEKHLPADTEIVSCHSLHGPSVSPVGQPLVLIRHRASVESLNLVEKILSCFGSRYVYMSYDEHDLVTANTQAVTHAAFLSMGTAWASIQTYPWEHGLYVGGIETAKVNIMLRIYSNKWHVYAGLAILNPSAKIQIDQFAASATALFTMMLGGDASPETENKFRERIEWAGRTVFGAEKTRTPILLSSDVLDRFSLGTPTGNKTDNANSHLSLLAMVDCWAHLNIQPFEHLLLAATPIFRLFLGVAEHLFRSPTLLQSAIHSALHDTWHRQDDLEFVVAARGWSQCVSFGSFELYRRRFDETRAFFESRFEEAGVMGGEMIKAIMESEKLREEKS